MTIAMAEAIYGEDGKLTQLLITWKDEGISLVLSSNNAPTREFQRADEIVQALILADFAARRGVPQ